MGLLVRIDLHPLWGQANLIVHHNVVGGGDRPLADMLAHNEEVIPATHALQVNTPNTSLLQCTASQHTATPHCCNAQQVTVH